MAPTDYIEKQPPRIPRIPEMPKDLDITDLLIYEERQREEQRQRDEAFLRLPLYPPMPYHRPEPPKQDPERGVTIISYNS